MLFTASGRMRVACAVVLVLCVAARAAEPAHLTKGMAKAKCGQVIPYSRMRLDDLGPIEVAYDFGGVRKIAPAPPPGVHPRMLQGPEDRAEMRRIYTETPHGKHMWRMLTGWCDILKGKITSKDQCPTHADGRMLAAYHRSGFARLADQYKRILAGDMEGYTPGMNDYVLGCMAMEAFFPFLQCLHFERLRARIEACPQLLEAARGRSILQRGQRVLRICGPKGPDGCQHQHEDYQRLLHGRVLRMGNVVLYPGFPG